MDLLVVILSLPVLGALASAVGARRGRRAAAWTAALFLAAPLCALTAASPGILAGRLREFHCSWVPSIGLEAAFRLDGLSLVFGGLVLAMGILVVLYAYYYMPATDRMGRLYGLLLLFAGSMVGLVLADDLLILFLFWEGTSLTSFLLVGYNHGSAEARRGARMALVVTAGGGLALLAGLLLLGHVCGTRRISEILAMGDAVRGHALYGAVLGLILLGAFTKSAQFPFHFWLPAAMAAPTPVSAYLHSATMVKAGVFLLARFFPVFSGTLLWFYLVAGVGLATLLVGAYIALFKHDLKELLAYSTVGHLGLITLLFGFGTPLGAVAGVFHILNHATFKASLFMAAGILDHETGTRDMRRLNGLWRYMPHTALLATVSAAAMAGVPLLNGFLSKEMFFAEAVHQTWLGRGSWVLTVAATLAGLFSVAYSLRFIHDVFFDRPSGDLSPEPHEPPRWMKIPVEVLAGLCLLVGILPERIVRPLLDVAAAAVLQGELPRYSLALWHGLTPPLVMSAVALIGGVTLYGFRTRVFRLHDAWFPVWTGEGFYDRMVKALFSAGSRITAWLDNGSLGRYSALLVGAAVLVAGWPFLDRGRVLLGPVPFSELDGPSVVAASLLIVATFAVVLWRGSPLAAVVSLGVVGLVVTLAFVHFSAPDLALTQIAVEMVSTVLLLLVLYYMPQEWSHRSRAVRRLRNGVLAGLAGLGAAGLTLGVLTRTYNPLSDYYLAASKPLAGGSNAVNVILVDFRGFDTLGEITVLAIAALAIFALLDGLRERAVLLGCGTANRAAEIHPPILANLSRPLLPLALLVAVFLFLRGHNRPGGGFVAGLVVSTVLILQHLASGIEWTHARLRFRYLPVIAAGLLIAALTGLGSLLFGRPFLTSAIVHVRIPLLGDWEIASSTAFDLGVFLAVVGTVMLILVGLGRLSLGPERVPHPQESRGERS